MVHVRPALPFALSAFASVALLLGLAPGCSGNSSPPPTTAIGNWTIQPGLLSTNGATSCGAGGGVTWSIGNPEGSPIQTANTGSTFGGIAVNVSCTVTPDSGGFNVNANVTYGSKGSLTIIGQFNVAPNTPPPATTGIHGEFNSDAPGYIAQLSDTNCTVTFTKNANMGIAATRIWGYIDCENASDSSNGQTCDANAEFIFENCGQ